MRHTTNLNDRDSRSSTSDLSPGFNIAFILIVLAVTVPFSLMMLSVLFYGIFMIISAFTTPDQHVVFRIIMAVIGLALCSGSLLFFSVGIGFIIGKIKAKYKIHQESTAIAATNPYQYYRELPNNYGIGVTTILIDSRIENEKDIVATILDLCAQKYLHLEKLGDTYQIKILRTDLSPLLSNERYIMELLIQGKISNISYPKWFHLCVEDGIRLKLFVAKNYKQKTSPTHTTKNSQNATNNSNQPDNLLSKIIKKQRNILGIAIAITFIVLIPIGFACHSMWLIMAPISFISVICLFGHFSTIITTSFIFIATSAKDTYRETLQTQIKRTQHGNAELQKLYAFKAFIRDFGNFVDKRPEEVILWDHYLSYAQVFGLTKEIMSSGYDQLIHNAAFKIDNINNIQINKITFATSNSNTSATLNPTNTTSHPKN